MQEDIRDKIAEDFWFNQLKNLPEAANQWFGVGERGRASIPVPEDMRNHCGFLFCQYILKLVYAEYADCKDVVIATPCLNGLGFLRTIIDEEMPVNEALLKEGERWRSVERHSKYNYAKVMRKLEANGFGKEERFLRLGFCYDSLYGYNDILSRCNLTIKMSGERVDLQYDLSVFDDYSANRFLENYLAAMQSAADDPEMKTGRVDTICVKEKDEIVAFGRPEGVLLIDETVVDVFYRQVAEKSDKLAVVYGNTELTYGNLNKMSDAVAMLLREKYGVNEGDVVGMMLGRSEMLAVVTIGVLKSGGTFLAIDPTYPNERKSYILFDSGCKVLVSEDDLVSGSKEYWTGQICTAKELLCEPEEAFEHVKISIDLPSFIIYTSGSTGVPKGILQTHRCLQNVVMRQIIHGGFESGLRILQYSSVSFDVFIAHELFFCLLSGGVLYIVEDDNRDDLVRLGKYIVDRKIQWLLLPVSVLNLVVEVSPEVWKSGLSLKFMVSAGEQLNLSGKLVEFLELNPHLDLHNFYGPSETHNAINYKINRKKSIGVEQPIGRPAMNTWVYILTKNMKIAPIGIRGEIFISGAGLAKGYINNNQLTNERFIPNPYLAGESMYRTGDMGRWLPDGNAVFLGRIDDQVKIRGGRIELGEIESRLIKYAGIRQCAVLARDIAGTMELIAYVACGWKVSVGDLRKFLLPQLPGHMIPGYFVQLPFLPLNANGKVDKRGLPAPDGVWMSSGSEYIAPRFELEQQLAEIWRDILGREKIGIEDDFFDLGGHSLRATQLMSRILRKFDIKVPLEELFTSRKLREQAALIEEMSRQKLNPTRQSTGSKGYEMSSAQRSVWELGYTSNGIVGGNVSAVYVLSGQLKEEILFLAFDAAIDRYEILRTVFFEDEKGKALQYVREREETGFKIIDEDIRSKADQEAILQGAFKSLAFNSFDVANGPLVRVFLYRTSDNEWVLACALSPLTGDERSIALLMYSVWSYYNGYRTGTVSDTAPLLSQYKDYAIREQKRMRSGYLLVQKAYWVKQLSGNLPLVDLAVYRSRPPFRAYEAGAVSGSLDPDLVAKLYEPWDGDVHSLTGFLSIAAILIYRYTGRQDMIIGIPSAGREQDWFDQIGLFVNLLPVRIKLQGGESYRDVFTKVGKVIREAYEHQDYPFDELVKDLDLPFDRSRHPLFDLVLSVQDTGMQAIENRRIDGLQVKRHNSIKSLTSKFDLLFNIILNGDERGININYDMVIYDEATVSRIMGHFEGLIKAAVMHPYKAIAKLDYMSREEREMLMRGILKM